VANTIKLTKPKPIPPVRSDRWSVGTLEKFIALSFSAVLYKVVKRDARSEAYSIR